MFALFSSFFSCSTACFAIVGFRGVAHAVWEIIWLIADIQEFGGPELTGQLLMERDLRRCGSAGRQQGQHSDHRDLGCFINVGSTIALHSIHDSMMEWFVWSSVPCVFFGLWIYTAWLSQSFPTLQGKRIALLIAHPDDEAMFFAPALLSLSRPELANHIKILCLTSGLFLQSANG